MTGGFEADVDRLVARAKDFDGLADHAGTISADLDRALEGAEAAWGDDVVGKSFAAAHADAAREVADRLRALAGGLGDFGGSLGEAAQRYRAGDSDAAEAVDGAAAG